MDPSRICKKKMGKEIMIYRMTDRTDRHTNTQPDSKEDLGAGGKEESKQKRAELQANEKRAEFIFKSQQSGK